jgi:ketopantoate reductase
MFLAILKEVGIIVCVMRVTILGPGSVGTLLGGLLALKGHQVILRSRRALAQTRSAKPRAGRAVPPAAPIPPLRIVLPEKWLMVEGLRPRGPEEESEPPDAVLVTLGRQHLHALRRPDFARFSGPADVPVVMFNCDPAETDRLAVPPEKLRLGVTLMTAVKLQDADVELATPKPVILYEAHRTLDRLFRDLAVFGFQAAAVPDARPYLNSLLVWQLLFLPVAMCNTTLDVFLAFPEGRELAAGIIAEGCAAMEKAGMPMAALPLMDPRDLAARLERKPGTFDSDTGRPDRAYNSLLQCYLKGRPTEAPQLNRRIVEIASAVGLHLTWNWRILQKVSRVSGLGFYRTPAELLRSLA